MSSEKKDYYAILGVTKRESTENIKKAYRVLALKWHPDKTLNCSEESKQKFLDISEAFEVLSNPNKRTSYDVVGYEGIKNSGNVDINEEKARSLFTNVARQMSSFGVSGFTINEANYQQELGDDFFSGENIFFNRLQRKDPPVVKEVEITLNDLYQGTTKYVTIERADYQEEGDNKEPFVYKSVVNIVVKPGGPDQIEVVMENLGDLYPNRLPANFVFRTVLKPDLQFQKKQSHLLYTHQLSVRDMICGKKVTVPTLDGLGILHEQDIRGVINPQIPIVVKNKGFVDSSSGESKAPSFNRGDLVIQFDTTHWEGVKTEDVVHLLVQEGFLPEKTPQLCSK